MLRTALRTLAAASITLALVGCEDAARPVSPKPTTSNAIAPVMSLVTDGAAPPIERTVAPQATDPAINVSLADHYVWLDTTARGNPKLLVFMPGTNNVPSSWTRLGREAARLGYHVIGLSYQNTVEVIGVCTGSPDPDCSGNMRREILDGSDVSGLVTVTWANSIDNRVAKLLAYLDGHYPAEGWSRFLNADSTPKWSQIAVAGQSQGAGQAALIGKLRLVDRVVMFSGPPDLRVPGEVDAWVAIGKTPAAKYFALFHQHDHVVVGIRTNLAGFDLLRFGDPVVVEHSESPYGETHILTTDLRPTLGCDRPNPHQSTAKNNNTPLTATPDSTPLLRDAWRYLLGARGASAVPSHLGADTAATCSPRN